jgi:hypothetical protein
MNLVNMAMTVEEAAEYAGGAPVASGEANDQGPKYPWGLCVDLNDDSMAKLGITELPAAGSQMMLAAAVIVNSTGAEERLGGEKEIRMTLQITDMALSAPVADIEERAAAKLWPTS